MRRTLAVALAVWALLAFLLTIRPPWVGTATAGRENPISATEKLGWHPLWHSPSGYGIIDGWHERPQSVTIDWPILAAELLAMTLGLVVVVSVVLALKSGHRDKQGPRERPDKGIEESTDDSPAGSAQGPTRQQHRIDETKTQGADEPSPGRTVSHSPPLPRNVTGTATGGINAGKMIVADFGAFLLSGGSPEKETVKSGIPGGIPARTEPGRQSLKVGDLSGADELASNLQSAPAPKTVEPEPLIFPICCRGISLGRLALAPHQVVISGKKNTFGKAALLAVACSFLSMMFLLAVQSSGSPIVVPGFVGWLIIWQLSIRRNVTGEADPRNDRAIYDQADGVVRLQLSNSRRVTFELRGARDHRETIEKVFLPAMRTAYGDRLSLQPIADYPAKEKIEWDLHPIKLTAVEIVGLALLISLAAAGIIGHYRMAAYERGRQNPYYDSLHYAPPVPAAPAQQQAGASPAVTPAAPADPWARFKMDPAPAAAVPAPKWQSSPIVQTAPDARVPPAPPVSDPPSEDIFHRLARQRQAEAAAYCDRGNANFLKGDLAEAIRDYDKAIELNPKYVHAYYYRGYTYLEKGSKDKAIDDFNKVIELDPTGNLGVDARAAVFRKFSEWPDGKR